MMTYFFTIKGEPVGKGRPKTTMIGGYAHTYTPKKTVEYERLVANSYISIFGDNKITKYPSQPLGISLHIYIALRKADFGKKGINKSGIRKMEQKYCQIKPDIDNIIKSVLDGLNGVAFYDDSQVVTISATKEWVEKDSRIEVELYEKGEN